MQVSANISGLYNLDKLFKALPASTQNKAARPALRAGARVIRNEASTNIQSVVSDEATGLAARSLRVYSLRKYQGQLRVAVMVKRGVYASNGARVGLYASVLEYRPGMSWIRKAARDKKAEAVAAVRSEMSKRINDAVKDAQR